MITAVVFAIQRVASWASATAAGFGLISLVLVVAVACTDQRDRDRAARVTEAES